LINSTETMVVLKLVGGNVLKVNVPDSTETMVVLKPLSKWFKCKYVRIPPKQWLYWNFLHFPGVRQNQGIPPKQWLYWNFVILQVFGCLKMKFHRNNGCIETSEINTCPSTKIDSTETMVVLKHSWSVSYKTSFWNSTETMVVLKHSAGLYPLKSIAIPPKQWLYWN